jgi:ribosomal 30S subunit maturation factor RimM
LIIDKRKFKLFCGSVFDNETYDVGHLVTIFDINNDLFVVNAIGKQCEFLPPFYPNILNQRRITSIMKHHKNIIGTAFYYLTT